MCHTKLSNKVWKIYHFGLDIVRSERVIALNCTLSTMVGRVNLCRRSLINFGLDIVRSERVNRRL